MEQHSEDSVHRQSLFHSTVPLSAELQTVVGQVETFLSRSSRAEAVIRVFFMEDAAIPDNRNIKLSLQLSIPRHSILTDFLFLVTNDASGWPLTFIEVKPSQTVQI